MKMKTRISVLSVLLIAAGSLYAQHSVRGKVVSSDGSPLSDVSVSISETYYKTNSNSSSNKEINYTQACSNVDKCSDYNPFFSAS